MYVVTGAIGFIGSAFVWELNEQGHTDIVCVDVEEDQGRHPNLQKRSFKDYVSKDKLIDYLDNYPKSVTAVIHMGACSNTTETNREYIMETNLEYSQKLFSWCAEHNKRFIYASSAATYGNGSNGYDDNVSPEKLIPLNLYGESKVLFDRWVLQQDQTPSHWAGLKFFNVYGPQEYHKEDMASVVFKAANEIASTGELQLFKSHNPKYEDGKQMRDFVYIKDITNWMYALLTQDPLTGIYNMGSGKSRTWLDLAENVFHNMQKDIKINWIDIPDNIRDQYQYFTEAKMDKLLSLGLNPPQWSLEQGIEDYLQNYILTDDTYL